MRPYIKEPKKALAYRKEQEFDEARKLYDKRGFWNITGHRTNGSTLHDIMKDHLEFQQYKAHLIYRTQHYT